SATGQINNGGLIDVTGTTTLNSDVVFNSTAAGTRIKVEASELLKLDDTRIFNGAVTDNGTIEVLGVSTLNNVTLTINSGGQLTLDPGSKLNLTGSTITGNGLINDGTGASGATLDVQGSSTISGATLNNGG